VVHDRVNAAFAIARLAIRLQGGFDLSPEPGVSRLRVPYDPPVSDKDQDSAPRLSLEYIDVTEVHREFLPAVAALCKAAESDPSLDVRVNAVFAVGAISPGEREAHAMLLGALSNAESRVGNNALAALTHYGRRAAAFAVELTEIARTGSVRAATRACAVLRAIRWANADMVVENFRRRLEQGDVASRAELDVVLSTSDREWFARLLPELVSD